MSITNFYSNNSTPGSTVLIKENPFSQSEGDKSLLKGIPLKKTESFIERLYYRIVNSKIAKNDKRLLVQILKGAIVNLRESKSRVLFVGFFERLIGYKEFSFNQAPNVKSQNNDADFKKNVQESMSELNFDENVKSTINLLLTNKKDIFTPSK